MKKVNYQHYYKFLLEIKIVTMFIIIIKYYYYTTKL